MLSKRPLSPHLSVHKKVLTAVFSIFHRLTGIALSLGAVLLSIWICLIALGQDYFFIFQKISAYLFIMFLMEFATYFGVMVK